MRKKSKIQEPVSAPSSRGVPILSILFGLLFLSLAGLAGWLYWTDIKKDQTSPSAASVSIAPPVKPSVSHDKTDDRHKEEQPKAGGDHDKKNTEPLAAADQDHAAKESETTTPAMEEQAEKESDDHAPTAKGQTNGKTEAHSSEMGEHVSEEKRIPASEKPEAPAPVATKQAEEIKDAHAPTTQKHIEEKPESPAPQVKDPVEETKDTHASAEVDHKEKKRDAPAGIKKSNDEPAPAKPSPEAPLKIEPVPEEKITLPPVPDPELTKKSDYGLLPVIGPTGRLPWRIYRRPFEDPLDRPRIAIIISEMGMSSTATKSTIQNLPGPVTLSFNPYGRDLQSWVEQARAAGHEVLLQLPMEPFGYPKNDPGPHSLLTNLTDRENLKRLEWMLGRFTGYSGVTNQMGSKFTATADEIGPVLKIVKTRGLLFLDGRTSAKSVAAQISSETGVPVAVNNRFLDHKADRVTIDARLKDLERIARYTGTAVGIGYPYPVTLERISLWAQSLARKGFVLVPVSAAVNRQEIR